MISTSESFASAVVTVKGPQQIQNLVIALRQEHSRSAVNVDPPRNQAVDFDNQQTVDVMVPCKSGRCGAEAILKAVGSVFDSRTARALSIQQCQNCGRRN